jgi:ribosome-binding factor A
LQPDDIIELYERQRALMPFQTGARAGTPSKMRPACGRIFLVLLAGMAFAVPVCMTEASFMLQYPPTRLAELLFEELSIMSANELADPRVSLVRVTHVDVSRDLRTVKVHISHDDDSVTKAAALQGLRHATPYLRREIATRCSLRAVPDLLFYYDDTPENAARVDTLLRQIAEERASRPPAADSGELAS